MTATTPRNQQNSQHDRVLPPWQPLPDGLVLRSPGRRTLWLSGDLQRLSRPRIAVIGSRTPSPRQAELAALLCDGLSRAGAAICSGGALGIDAIAHESTLRAEGITALVSPVAPERVYPTRHADLFARVRRTGVLLTAFAPETAFSRSHFRSRNVILARLVDALVVICADRRSGSLHCARQAWKLGLPVYAVPWDPGSLHAEGTNLLLSAGARAMVSAQQGHDLVEQLRTGGGRSLLQRDATPPQFNLDARSAIDASGGRWQRYAPVEPRPQRGDGPPKTEQATNLTALSTLDDDGEIRQMLAQQGDGICLEKLVQASGRPRAHVASLLLRWTLEGSVRRDSRGRYRDA